jgi:hypothetical protein
MTSDEHDWDLFYERITSRTRRLIETQIWEGIERDRLEYWLNAFDSHGCDRILPAILLDGLIFRSRNQFIALMRHLLYLLSRSFEGVDEDQFVARLQSHAEHHIRFVPVIGATAPPTKSGPYVLRILQRLFRVRNKWLIWPAALEKLSSEVRVIVFVDDFCGTGTQFTDFLMSTNAAALKSERPNMRFVYLLAAAHIEGIAAIQKQYPFIEIICADQLTRSHDFFSPVAFERYREPDIGIRVNEEYTKLAESIGLPKNPKLDSSGFGKLGLSYGFFHSTPNNTLPVFWYETNVWKPLLAR